MAREGVFGVAVLLIPVARLGGRDPRGLVVIRRDVEPERGKLALPGGFIDPTGETWQEACVREAREESSEVLNLRADTVRLWDVQSTPNRLLLVFGIVPPIDLDDFAEKALHFTPNNEVTELTYITDPTELAFPLHTKAVAQWFHRT